MKVKEPIFDFDDRFFWEGATAHRLLIQECGDCGALRHPPTPMCPRCGSTNNSARESAGNGTILTWIVSKHPTEPEAEPRIVILVQLDEGTRIVSNLIGLELAEGEFPELNDARVEVCFIDFEGTVLPQFRLVEVAR